MCQEVLSALHAGPHSPPWPELGDGFHSFLCLSQEEMRTGEIPVQSPESRVTPRAVV